MNARLSGLLLVLPLVGCAISAREPPGPGPLPQHYALVALPAAPLQADGAEQRLLPAMAPLPQWWRAYRSDALDALVAEGLAGNATLASAQATLRAAREELRAQIGGNLLPGIDVGFDQSRQRALGLPGFAHETFLYDVFALEAQASYRFDFFGAARLADRSLAGQVQVQALQFESIRRALAANIVVATISVAALNEELQASESAAALAERNADQVRERAALGGASRPDVEAAEASAAAAAGGVPVLRQQLLAARHAQAVLLGRRPDQAPEPLALSALQVPDRIPVSVPAALLQQRPDIRAAEAAVRAAANAAGAAEAALFPTLSLTAAFGRGGFDWSTFNGPGGAIWSVGAGLTAPVFHGGALRARHREAEAQYDAAAWQYRQTVLGAFQEVGNALSALEQDTLALSQAGRAATAAAGAAADLQERYRWGAVPLSATFLAGQQDQDARVGLLRARAARLLDTATLLQAMGEVPRVD